MISLTIVLVVAIVAFATFQLGLFDRNAFVYSESFLGNHELLAIVATTRERNIGQHVERLLTGSQKGVEESVPNGKALMTAAAKVYGSPEGATALSTGLYFDDPNVEENPKWAIGFAVEGASYEELRAMLPSIQKASGLTKDSMKVARIGSKGTRVFTARIPWRNMFTPMIAPMLHWKRGFQTYEDYIKENPSEKGEVDPIALEVYVTGAGESRQYIDYIVLFGDVGKTREDTFPETKTKSEPKETPVQEKVEEEEEAAPAEETGEDEDEDEDEEGEEDEEEEGEEVKLEKENEGATATD